MSRDTRGVYVFQLFEEWLLGLHRTTTKNAQFDPLFVEKTSRLKSQSGKELDPRHANDLAPSALQGTNNVGKSTDRSSRLASHRGEGSVTAMTFSEVMICLEPPAW